MAGKICLIRAHFFGNSTCWSSCPFPSAPKSGLIPPSPHSLSGSLPGWSQTPVSPSLSPQELGQLPSLSWCWNNFGLRVSMSQTLGKSCLKPGRLLLSEGPVGRGYAAPNRLEFPKGLYLSVSGSPPEWGCTSSLSWQWVRRDGQWLTARAGGEVAAGPPTLCSFPPSPSPQFSFSQLAALACGRRGSLKKYNEEDKERPRR